MRWPALTALLLLMFAAGCESPRSEVESTCVDGTSVLPMTLYVGPKNIDEINEVAKRLKVCVVPNGAFEELQCGASRVIVMRGTLAFGMYVVDSAGAVVAALTSGDLVADCLTYQYGDVSACGANPFSPRGELVQDLCVRHTDSDGVDVVNDH